MPRRDAPGLTLPFALLGLVGGWAVADVHGLQVGHFETAARALLCLITPVVAGYLGAAVGRRVSDGPATHALGFCLTAALAGVVNGALVGLFVVPPWGALFGAVWGGLCSLPFLPVLGLIVASSRRCAAARPRSVLRAVRARGVWATTLLAAALALGAPLVVRASPPGRPSVAVAVAVCAAAVAGIAALALRDGLLLASLRAPSGEGWRLRDEADPIETRVGGPPSIETRVGGPPSIETRVGGPPSITEDAAVVDLGEGDDVWERVAPATAPYRSTPRVVRVVRGSLEQTRRSLRRALWLRVLALGVASAVLLAYVERAPDAEEWAARDEMGWD